MVPDTKRQQGAHSAKSALSYIRKTRTVKERSKRKDAKPDKARETVLLREPTDGSAAVRQSILKKSSKKFCRNQISAEQNISVRTAGDSPLLSRLPRFAAQVLNKMRIGKDGKTIELRRTGRRWRKPMEQFGEKVCRKIGEKTVSVHLQVE